MSYLPSVEAVFLISEPERSGTPKVYYYRSLKEFLKAVVYGQGCKIGYLMGSAFPDYDQFFGEARVFFQDGRPAMDLTALCADVYPRAMKHLSQLEGSVRPYRPSPGNKDAYGKFTAELRDELEQRVREATGL